MTLRPSELLLVAGEIAQRLPGRSVQKVMQPDEQSVVLGLSGAWLQISLDPRKGRLHLVDERPGGTGEAASSFCMQLRKELIGLRFVSVEPVLGERALALEFARDGVHRFLRLFFYGAGARMGLLDETERVLGALPQKAAHQAGAFTLPPPRSDDDEADGSHAGRPPRFSPPEVSRQIAAHYGEATQSDAVTAERTRAVSAAKRDIEKRRRLEAALTLDYDRIASASARRQHADLLLAHLGEIPRGAREVVLPDDFEGGPPVTIVLDPARSAQDNAARLYHEAKRLARGRLALERRLTETRRAREQAEANLAAIEAASPIELAALATRVPHTAPQRSGSARQERDAPRRPYRVFRSTSGAEIFVGKGADKNDALTFHVARGNDLWLHTRDVPGAHVVVPLAGRPIDEQTLIEAAMLAVHFSPARPEEMETGAGQVGQLAQADVTYALRKFVKKPRNAAPGRVSVAGGKTLRVRLEPDRLRRLLASREDD